MKLFLKPTFETSAKCTLSVHNPQYLPRSDMTTKRLTTSGSLGDVINGGYCIGCGACAGIDPAVRMTMDREGRIVAVLPEGRDPSSAATAACPFTGAGPDETALARELYDATGMVEDARIGRHLACFAGWATEDDLRARGSSGGIGTWLQKELLARGLVDAVLDVTPRPGQRAGPLFAFTVARTPEEVVANAKTRYHPVEMSGVIRHVLETTGRYAAIGTPCFAKALRLAARQSPELAERLHFVLGIVCGHLKTTAFSEVLAWQCGIDPDGIETIDFRAKIEGRPASRYGVSVTGRKLSGGGSDRVTRPMEGLMGADWGQGLFKYRACEFCDDVLAETADAVVGDAWLPAYDADHRGTNVVVVRDPRLLDLLARGRDERRLHLEALTADDVAKSQAGGLRHRRAGLAYRLHLTDREGLWRPEKRVSASRTHLSPLMRRIHEMRLRIGQESHLAWREARAAGDLSRFTTRMEPMIATYHRLMKPGLLQRTLSRLGHRLETVLGQVGRRK